jgi:hypothetical protein
MCSRLSKFKDSLITPDEAPAEVEAMIAEANRNSMPVDAPGLRTSARVYADYQRRLRDANAADFGDLLLWPARAMQRSESYRTRWASRFDCVLADEFRTSTLRSSPGCGCWPPRMARSSWSAMTTRVSMAGAGPMSATSAGSRAIFPMPRCIASRRTSGRPATSSAPPIQ